MTRQGRAECEEQHVVSVTKACAQTKVHSTKKRSMKIVQIWNWKMGARCLALRTFLEFVQEEKELKPSSRYIGTE